MKNYRLLLIITGFFILTVTYIDTFVLIYLFIFVKKCTRYINVSMFFNAIYNCNHSTCVNIDGTLKINGINTFGSLK